MYSYISRGERQGLGRGLGGGGGGGNRKKEEGAREVFHTHVGGRRGGYSLAPLPIATRGKGLVN